MCDVQKKAKEVVQQLKHNPFSADWIHGLSEIEKTLGRDLTAKDIKQFQALYLNS